MKRAVLALALVAATSSIASAGRYLGIGVGTNAVTEGKDQLSNDGRSARLIGGMRWGQLSIEGMFSGYGVALADRSGATPLDAYQVSVAGKYNLPLGNAFEAYGRAGLQHTWVSGEVPIYGASGNGFLLGAGFEYRLKTGIASGSVWVDYQINKAQLTGDRFTYDATTRQWTLGLSVGF
jgi:opacity protein-like surface antigen